MSFGEMFGGADFQVGVDHVANSVREFLEQVDAGQIMSGPAFVKKLRKLLKGYDQSMRQGSGYDAFVYAARMYVVYFKIND